jgi:hypothetical protein
VVETLWIAAIAAAVVVVGCATSSSSVPPGGGDDGGPEGVAAQPHSDADVSSADTSAAPPEAGTSGTSDGPPKDAAESGTTSLGCSALPLCDDFESDTPGMVPSASVWSVSMGCNPNTQNTAFDGGGLVIGVDSSQAHSGKNSVRVVGGDSCGFYLVNTSAFAGAKGLGPQLYARFYARFSGAPTQGHNGFLSMSTGSDHLRLGFQDAVIAWNAQSSDATLPDMDQQGTTLSAATTAARWSCIEFHIDETNGHIEFWLDGASVQGVSYDGGNVQGVNDQWFRSGPKSPVPVSFGLGWLGLNDQMTVWFDDVALANSRIGCN